MDLKNKIVVVTGGLSGLGWATVQETAQRGAHVAVLDLTKPSDSVLNDYKQCRFFQVDVSSEQEVANATRSISAWSESEGLDVAAIVCCAGYLGPAKILSKNGSTLSLDKFKKVIDISLTGTIDVIRHLLPRMAQQQTDDQGQRGVIVTVASAAAFDGQEGQVAYSAAKGGIASMTLPLARDLSRYGIRAVCIAPGMFGTNMVAGMPEPVKKSLDKSLEYPKRAGRPDEFSRLVLHVLENNMLNGTVLRLDGAARMPSRL